MSDEFLVHADNIVAGYVPEVDNLNGCSLKLSPGELVGIIGPNGAGKSTLLKALFGLLDVRKGTVTFKGEDITGLTAHELVSRGIGYVPQNNNVFPSLTISENLEMGVFLRPKEFKGRLEFVTDMFPRLGERLNQRAGSLSGGERQMLAMSRALRMDPELLLLDEPTAGMARADTNNTIALLKEIKEKRNITMAIIEHDMHVVFSLADRITVLAQGTPLVEDTPENIKGHPKVREAYLGEAQV